MIIPRINVKLCSSFNPIHVKFSGMDAASSVEREELFRDVNSMYIYYFSAIVGKSGFFTTPLNAPSNEYLGAIILKKGL